MSTMASHISSLAIVYSIVYSDADQRKHLSSASLAIVRGIYRWPVNSPHKGPVKRKMFLLDYVIICFLPGFFSRRYFWLTFSDQVVSFKMADEILRNIVLLWVLTQWGLGNIVGGWGHKHAQMYCREKCLYLGLCIKLIYCLLFSWKLIRDNSWKWLAPESKLFPKPITTKDPLHFIKS